MKIRNDDDKTIFEIKLENTAKEKKAKPSVVVGVVVIIVVALGISVFLGYLLHKII